MKHMLSAPEIYLYRESVDFRKSINGLAAIIESDTDLPLGSGALFLFTNKQRDKIKVLYWDKTGFALWYKRLEKAKYKWALFNFLWVRFRAFCSPVNPASISGITTLLL